MTTRNWITSGDVQHALGVSHTAVADLVRRGLLHPEIVGDQRPTMIFSRAEVDQLAGARASAKLDREGR